MQRYFIHLCYDGTRYHGWQIQPSANSVQQELQFALSTILRVPIEVVGAGRTDTGVHARHMVAHFDFDTSCIPQPLLSDLKEDESAQQTPDSRLRNFADNLAYRLNRMLPRDISVYRVEPVDEEMHARFSACARTYHYYIHTMKNPFRRDYSCELHYPLDFSMMNEAASHLLKVDDFGAFCKAHTDVKTTICHVSEAEWVRDGEAEWHFRITANRFLRNMVRAVVGTLIDVGRGRVSVDEFDRIVAGKKRTEAGESMPAKALFLERVEY
ncbi:MAG: tRNA pseudouridine(38-40) synthase TruA [Prevotella sp.]|nr:tRNA pseudouridine(38-40) synthase TruA [Prevotella sp.]